MIGARKRMRALSIEHILCILIAHQLYMYIIVYPNSFKLNPGITLIILTHKKFPPIISTRSIPQTSIAPAIYLTS